MDRLLAERLMAAALAMDSPLGEMDDLISEIADRQEREAYVRALGEALWIFNEGFIRPIAREYPDLAPND